MSGAAGEADLIRVVLADANVLYSRVLRDFLLYAADQEIVAIAWSSQILPRSPNTSWRTWKASTKQQPSD